jgi:hypothetical protein
MEPMLFATIGTSIVFAELPQGTIPKSVLVVCTGARAACWLYGRCGRDEVCTSTGSCTCSCLHIDLACQPLLAR